MGCVQLRYEKSEALKWGLTIPMLEELGMLVTADD